ncbi:MAG: NAD-dependent epimerase/dehydratase family protein [Candidatus Kariarchaeaceae archaeon]
MKVLVIGGTKFVGRAIIDSFLRNGHEITMFNRGKTNPNLYKSKVTQIKGDREKDLEKLGDKSWDVVIDTCGYVPRIVKLSVDYLKDKVKNYVFISSVSAYSSKNKKNVDERAELATLEDETVEEITGESYGGLKVLCENEVFDVFKDRTTILRPGLIVGPHDPTNRFSYWPIRIRKGGEILAPGDGKFNVQVIDVRDLAEFCLHLAEKDNSGIFNLTGHNVTMREFLDICVSATSSEMKIHWIDEKWLLEQKVEEWMELPLWISDENYEFLSEINFDKAVNSGLKFRTIEATIIDLLQWYDEIDGDSKEWPAGMKPEREKELLKMKSKI